MHCCKNRVASAKRRLTMLAHLSKRLNHVRKRSSNQQDSDGTFGLRAEHSSDLHSCTTRLPFTRRSSGRKMRRTVVEWRTTRDVLNTEQAVLHEILSRIAECRMLFKRALFQNVAQKAQQERSKDLSKGGFKVDQRVRVDKDGKLFLADSPNPTKVQQESHGLLYYAILGMWVLFLLGSLAVTAFFVFFLVLAFL